MSERVGQLPPLAKERKEDDLVTKLLRGNCWSTLSIVITLGTYVLIWTIVEYLYSHGLWHNNDVATQSVLRMWEGIATVLSLGTAILGLRRDASKSFSIVALCISTLNFVFYTA